jgi:hypothetical protein
VKKQKPHPLRQLQLHIIRRNINDTPTTIKEIHPSSKSFLQKSSIEDVIKRRLNNGQNTDKEFIDWSEDFKLKWNIGKGTRINPSTESRPEKPITPHPLMIAKEFAINLENIRVFEKNDTFFCSTPIDQGTPLNKTMDEVIGVSDDERTSQEKENLKIIVHAKVNIKKSCTSTNDLMNILNRFPRMSMTTCSF